MKKILATTVAVAALAFAAPAFAQVVNDVTGTVQGQAQVQGQVDPQDVTDPLAQTREDTQNAVRGQVDEAQDALPQQPDASITAEGAAEVPGVTGEGQVSAQIAPPSTDAATQTADDAVDTADAAVDTATDAAPAMSAEADTAVTASAGTRGASASTETAAEAAADMPAPVQQAVNDGSYSTDDLNRAQLAALQSPTQGSR